VWLHPGVALTLMIGGIPAAGPTATISYEIFSVAGSDGRKSIARGVRTYTPACDVLIRKEGPRKAWSGSLDLSEGFAIGTTVYREPKLTGFGLVVERPDGGHGFSWDWFDLEQDNVFTKLQGAGRVAVEVARGPDYEEMQTVEFLDDVTLRYLDDTSRPPGTHTHEIVVGRGSVLRLAGGATADSKCPSPRPVRSKSAPKNPSPPGVSKALEEVQLWLTYYYLNPRPDLALQYLDVMDREGASVNHSLAEEVARGGMRSFFARVLERNGSVVADVSARMASLPAGQQAFLREALRRCETPACRGALPGAAVDQAVEGAGPDPSTLDDAWGSFFATGEERYIDEVVSVLPWTEVRGDIGRLMTGGAAQWSLASNAHQHSRVLAVIERRAVEATDPTKRILNEIVESARAARIKNPPPEPR
jgi:hypothetical protein